MLWALKSAHERYKSYIYRENRLRKKTRALRALKNGRSVRSAKNLQHYPASYRHLLGIFFLNPYLSGPIYFKKSLIITFLCFCILFTVWVVCLVWRLFFNCDHCVFFWISWTFNLINLLMYLKKVTPTD